MGGLIMGGFFDRLRGRNRENSAGKAKERLQFVLVHDRINLPPERLQAMKDEILAVISKYVQIQSDKVDIALQQRERNSMIVAEIPFQQSPDQTSEGGHPPMTLNRTMDDETEETVPIARRILLDDDD